MISQPQADSAIGNLTHLDGQGHARMVDVTGKPPTRRLAVARCRVVTTHEALTALCSTQTGIDPVEAARVAAVYGAKQTSSLIPLCHPLHFDHLSIEIEVHGEEIEIVATCGVVDRTGVEMEALTACAVAGLSLVHCLLEFDPGVFVDGLTLWYKSGGRSGEWRRTFADSSS
jgi:cyclic pyranopterin monophosphate synthase